MYAVFFKKKVTCAHGPPAISGLGIYCRQDDGLARPPYCIVPSELGCCWYTRLQVVCHRYENRRGEHQLVSLSAFQLALQIIMIYVLQLLSLTPVIVVRPERQVRKAAEKRKADPDRG